MLGHTHAAIGALVGLSVAQATGAPGLLLMAAGGAAALLPDIDHPRGALRRRLGIAGHVGLFWLSHRGITHTALALALVAAGAWYLAPGPLALAVAAGYASHLLADMLTPAGLPVLWPVYRNNLHLAPALLRVRTGSLVETIIGAAVVIALWSVYANI